MRYLALLGVLAGAMLFAVSLWNLDAMMWYDHIWVYVPLIAWNVKVTKGEFVNVLYYLLVFSLVLTAVSSYALGRGREGMTFKEALGALAFPYILLGYALLLIAYLPYALIMDALEKIMRG